MEISNHLYPLKLNYITKTALWGGDKLIREYGKVFDGEKLSETWELSCRTPEESCMIENGPCAGMLLTDYFADYGKALIGEDYREEKFPLLIKWIDAHDTLSVQVHPDDAYALAHENDPGKTEMWYIAEAEPGAKLIYGLKDGVDREGFRDATARGDYASVMREVPVKKGEVYFIPSGMLHAIGAGILIAEIQQNSDLTYRVYDFDRRGPDGKLRPLHVQKALDVVRPFTEEEIRAVRFSAVKETEIDDDLLAACPYFRVRTLSAEKGEIEVSAASFVHVLCTNGEGIIIREKERYPIRKGESYLLPAALGTCRTEGDAELILSSL